MPAPATNRFLVYLLETVHRLGLDQEAGALLGLLDLHMEGSIRSSFVRDLRNMGLVAYADQLGQSTGPEAGRSWPWRRRH